MRMLRKFCDGKIPEVTSDDAEQLKALLAKCRKTMQKDCRDFPLDDADSSKMMRSSDINLNVSISPIHSAPTLNTNWKTAEDDSDCDRKIKKKKSKGKRKKKRSGRYSSSSEDESRSSRRKALFHDANPPGLPVYNHCSVNPYFISGPQYMAYAIPPLYPAGNVHGSSQLSSTLEEENSAAVIQKSEKPNTLDMQLDDYRKNQKYKFDKTWNR